MDKTEELLTKLVKLKSCGLINMRAECYGAIFEKLYDDPDEALKDYKELRRAHWTITDLKISTMPLTHFAKTYEELAKNKEEKKMLNFDKYREEVEKRIGWAVREGSKNPKPAHLILKEIAIANCLYMNGDELVDWLFEEYEPPLLENGDGLKPGDWIMVKNPDDGMWVKKIFAYYHDGYFYCATDIALFNNGWLVKREQARLPEDGE